MQLQDNLAFNYVVRALDIPALRFLDANCPQPRKIEWIDRTSDRRLRPTTVWQLNRTLQMPSVSPSVRRLHENSGIRSAFNSETERNAFARYFTTAKSMEGDFRANFLTASFKSLQEAATATTHLLEIGLPAHAIHILQSKSLLDMSKLDLPDGHGKLELANDMTIGGLMGIALGLVVLAVPVAGVVTLGGLLTTSAAGMVPAISGLLGVTGSAMAKMVSDHDVDGNALAYYQRQIQRGAVLLSLDLRECPASRIGVEQLLLALGAVINKR